MTKKHFIALADSIKDGLQNEHDSYMSDKAFDDIVAFCHSMNSRFNEHRFREYVSGRCGQNGGKVK